MKLLLLLSIVVLACTISPEPLATCSMPDSIMRDFPISLNEIQTLNVNDIFKGYNLNYTLTGAPDFVNLRQKFKLFKSQNITQPGFKSYHMGHEDNHWGRKLVTVSQAANSTIVRWGISSSLESIPTLDEHATVESDPNTRCFDAVWLRASGLIMVDCVRKGNFALQNVFLYLNATSQQVIQRQVLNDMWIGFTQISRRKIFHYIEDGEEYLWRAYFGDGVNHQQRGNTYAELLLINDPFRPWVIKVMDRSYLHQEELSITDFKIYLGDMYILDWHSGVISFDISPSQNVIIKGRYRTSSGYHKLGVYTNNLDNEVLLALANEHGIYEVDWSNQIRPVLMAKYSLMEGSRVSSLWVNEEYIACQVKANVTNSTNQTQEYHSTIIFDRGTRTYTNAYAVVHHSSSNVIIDMNLLHNGLLTIDEDSIDTYFIDEPMLTLYPTNPDILNKQFKFVIQGLSRNENNGHLQICSYEMVFVVVDVDSMALWPTGVPVPDTYYANFPGELVIPLNRYIIGANITWGVQEKVLNQTLDLPPHWILQQNDTIIHWDKEPSMFKYTFLRKEQFDYKGDQYFFIYTQDFTNVTHIAECKSSGFSKDVYCKQDSHQPQIHYKIDNLTATAFMPNYGEVLHLVAVLFEEFPNEVFIYNVRQKDMFSKPIIFEKQWQGQVQSVEFLGHYLAVVLRHIKTIVFYDMKACPDHQQKVCEQIFRIDSIMMGKLGIKYFSPLEVYTSDFHPFVLFIHNTDSVIILDITRQGPILLDQIDSPGSKEPGLWKWKMAITRGHLVIINPPNIIEEYSLNQLYTRKSTHMTKSYPLYNYTIMDKFDCDFSDEGDLLYITAIDKNLPQQKNTVILVYRSAGPAVQSLYDVFHIQGKYDDMLIDVTGNFADYVSVTMGSILMMFRQYGVPVLIFEDNWSDFDFNITYTNDPTGQHHYLNKSSVKISNYPEKIVINESKLNQSDFLTNQVNYDQKYQEVIIDDTNWFNGTVLNYTIEGCNECGEKIRVVDHLEDQRDFYSETEMEDYVFTLSGGVIQQFQSIIKMRHNGSIQQIAQFPSVLDGQHCMQIQHSQTYDFTISACEHRGEVYLYTTTFTSFKPFVNGPFYSGAKQLSGLKIMEDLLVVVDVDPNPWKMQRQGGIIIMAMNHNPFDPQMFDQIELIETDDLQHAINWPGGPVYIGNAEIIFTNETSLYRLAVTELRKGMFFVDFKWSRGRKSIQIIKVQFIDLNKLLINQNLHMPNNAFFLAVTLITEYYDTLFKYWEIQLVITTGHFHTLQFKFHIDKTGQVLQSKLAKVFYRYGYYQVQNYIKSFDGYFAIIHNLPSTLEPFEQMSRTVLSVYDTKERWIFNETTGLKEKAPTFKLEGTNISASWMLGGKGYQKGGLSFDFNFTLTRNRTDLLRDIGLLVIHERQNWIRQIAIHDHISIITEQGIRGTQNAKFKANSDFGSVQIPLSIIGIDDNDGVATGAIVAIVIGCVLIALAGGYFVYRWNLKRREKIGKELEDSLIDRDTLNVPKEEEESDDDEDDQDQDEDQQEDESEEQEQQRQQQAQTRPKPTAQGTSNDAQPQAQTAEDAGEAGEAVEQEKKQ